MSGFKRCRSSPEVLQACERKSGNRLSTSGALTSLHLALQSLCKLEGILLPLTAAHCPGAPGPLPSTTYLGLDTMPLHRRRVGQVGDH